MLNNSLQFASIRLTLEAKFGEDPYQKPVLSSADIEGINLKTFYLRGCDSLFNFFHKLDK